MTPKQRASWQRLSPNARRLLLSHRPDELEQEQTLVRETFADLTRAFGPQQWEASLAQLAEGEKTPADDEPAGGDSMTLEEVGQVLNLHRERVRNIQDAALSKLRARSDVFELHFGERRPVCIDGLEAAIRRAKHGDDKR